MLYNSENSSYQFARVDQFTPNSGGPWTPIGNVTSCQANSTNTIFTIAGTSPAAGSLAPVVMISILGPKAFRVRFNPNGDYSKDGSYAVVNKNLGAVTPTVLQNGPSKLSVNLGGIRLDVLFQPFTVQVYDSAGFLIHTDNSNQGLMYIPGEPGGFAVANFKNYPANANYFGFGEKGGDTLAMNQQSMTFFNYDNYKYSGANGGPASVVPPYTSPGPLNPSEPLYNSIPFLIEDNPNPTTGGAAYSYGLFLDNEGQTYFNIGQPAQPGQPSMYGKYYFGALYGEIDYYFMAGANTPEVLQQYSTLTGPAALAPMYVLGYHQGCYGYYDQSKVLGAAQSYRNAKIPLDGVHIDVDFQNNYRTFTASPEKFPGGGAPTFSGLAAIGVKASTNITGIVSIVPQDETGTVQPYSVLQSGEALNAFFKDVRADFPATANPGYFVTNEDYGTNTINPYQPPGSALGTYGYYADLGRPEIREWWGQQYKPLLDAGLEMVWQDMTDPATVQSISDPMPWKTLALDLLVTDTTTDSMVAHARIHNVFALNLISSTYEGMVQLRKASGVDKRPFIIARGGYAGVQRYAATWTGDSASDWGFLSILIPELLNFGLSGQPLAGSDVGGFAISRYGTGTNTGSSPYGNPMVQNGQVVGGITEPELLVRWTTASAFVGWFRNHYDGYNKQYQEPFAYPAPVPDICRKYIEIRYKLLQLFYDSLYECTQTGLPICRALFLTDRADINVYQHLNDQFMVGQNLLVAPVVTQGATSRQVYLPNTNSWFLFTDNQAPLSAPVAGGTTVNASAPLDYVPVYVRAGAIIPQRQLEQYVGQLPINPLSFDIYPGPASAHQLYQDDGVSMQAQANGVYRLTQISQSQTGSVQTVRVLRTYDHYTPPANYYYVRILFSTPPTSVSVNGATPTAAASLSVLEASPSNATFYDPTLKTTYVKVFDVSSDTMVTASF